MADGPLTDNPDVVEFSVTGDYYYGDTRQLLANLSTAVTRCALL
jgi:hypothetical protein